MYAPNIVKYALIWRMQRTPSNEIPRESEEDVLAAPECTRPLPEGITKKSVIRRVHIIISSESVEGQGLVGDGTW
jgi:hypothetical protein